MKKILSIAAILLCVMACKQKATDGFVIDGTLNGSKAENAIVKLYDAADMNMTVVDSAVVSKDGHFQLKGKVEEPAMYQVQIELADPALSEQERTLAYAFYIENAPMTFTADVETMPTVFYIPGRKTVNPVITGSPTQELNEKISTQLAEKENQLADLGQQLTQVYGDSAEQTSEATLKSIGLQNLMESLHKECDEIRTEFIRQHAASVVALDQALLLTYSEALTAKDFDDILALLEPTWKGKPRFEELKKQIEVKKHMARGSTLPDADFLTPDGKTVSLHSVLPKEGYTLVEFWASWCGPCRAEMPHLKQVAAKYPAFHIVSVSVDDDDAPWQQALEQEKLTWTQLRSPDGFQGTAQRVYGLMGVPACYLVDAEGKIVRGEARGPVLDKLLSELYGEKK